MASRSWWTVGCAVVALAIVGATFVLPWFTYTYSSGTRSPPGGPRGANDTSVERERIEFGPYFVRGDANASERAEAHPLVQNLGHLMAATSGLLALVLLLELAWGGYDWTRKVSIPFAFLSCGLVLAALAWAWFQFPPVLEGREVDGAFTSKAVPGGFIRTYVDAGFIVASVALAPCAAILAFKFAGGALDLLVVEKFRSRPRPPS